MKNIVGQIASKENFYPRIKETHRIYRLLEGGGSMQLSAPRRVGKSSILKSLVDTPVPGYYFVYIDVESARDAQNFYRKIYKEILKSDFLTKGKQVWQQLKDDSNHFFSRLKNIKIGGLGEIGLNEDTPVDYEEELINFLSRLNLGENKLVILIDEFPEVLLNIVEDQKGDFQLARSFLQSNRALRNNYAISGKVQFIYTGSSSLNLTAENLNSSELINDIASVPIDPLTPLHAADFVTLILKEYGYKIDKPEMDYMIKKVEWLIPFYFQLMIQEIIDMTEPKEGISKETIDGAVNKVSSRRNNNHFEHYVKRLRRVFPKKQYEFVQLFLNELCKIELMTRSEATNLAFDIISEGEVRKVLSSLIDDGYIVPIDSADPSYKFNSSILKNWWYNHEC